MDFSFLGEEYASQVAEWAVDLTILEEGLKKRDEERAHHEFMAIGSSTTYIAIDVALGIQAETEATVPIVEDRTTE